MDSDIIFHYFPNLTQRQQQQFQMLGDLYKEWNDKINVISRKDIDTLYERHILHSLAIAKFISLQPNASILDVGTGGGFPGIPLAILFPEVDFTLVDSIGKKIKVVQEVADAIQLKNVSAYHERAEKIKGTFDFVVTRAVARSRMIWVWSHQKLKSKSMHNIDNGIIALKGGNLEDEMKELNRPFQEIKIMDFFSEEFFETKSVIYIPK